MRSPSRPISSLLGAALLASALVAPVLVALPAQAAERSGREITTYLTIEGRRVVSIDVAGSDTAVSTAGDATFTNGSVALTEGGQPVGAFATKASVVIPDNGGRERRDTTVEVSMPTGALFAQQIQDDPTGRPPDRSSEMVVLGGTGAFRNARGVVSIAPTGAQGLKLVWKLAPEIGIDPESATTIAFERIVDADVSGQASNERNALTQDGSQGTLRLPGKDGRFTCGDTRLAQTIPGGIGLNAWLCRYDLPLGSVLVAAFSQYRGGTQAPTKFTDIVLGGTGAYAGAQGEAITDCTSETSADVTLRLLQATGQPPVPVKFNQARTYKTFGDSTSPTTRSSMPGQQPRSSHAARSDQWARRRACMPRRSTSRRPRSTSAVSEWSPSTSRAGQFVPSPTTRAPTHRSKRRAPLSSLEAPAPTSARQEPLASFRAR
ncbi:MAG: hypothetical protein F2702_05630, partial [Actinobacteria bacterium]|nr:hypothetical protein [Actinomycetota bacterium]